MYINLLVHSMYIINVITRYFGGLIRTLLTIKSHGQAQRYMLEVLS